VWTEPLTCVFEGFPKRVCFESLHDRQKGAGHSASSDGACLFDRAGRVWCCAIEPGRARTGRHGFLEIIHYFTVHSITWRALPSEFGSWNSVGRLSAAQLLRIFEAFFQWLAECSQTANLVQLFDSTTARAHVSAAGAKGDSIARRSAACAVVSRPKSICGRPLPHVRPRMEPGGQRAANIVTRRPKTYREMIP